MLYEIIKILHWFKDRWREAHWRWRNDIRSRTGERNKPQECLSPLQLSGITRRAKREKWDRNQKSKCSSSGHTGNVTFLNVGNKIVKSNSKNTVCRECSFLSLVHHCCCIASKHCTTLFSKWWGVKSLECGIQCRGYRGNYSELRTGWLPRERADQPKDY